MLDQMTREEFRAFLISAGWYADEAYLLAAKLYPDENTMTIQAIILYLAEYAKGELFEENITIG